MKCSVMAVSSNSNRSLMGIERSLKYSKMFQLNRNRFIRFFLYNIHSEQKKKRIGIKVGGKMFLRINFLIDTTQPTLKVDERCVNILDNCSNNVDITLKMKQNPKSVFPRRTTLIQRQCPTLKQGWTNITQRRCSIKQRCFNVVSTLMWHYLNVVSAWPRRNQSG